MLTRPKISDNVEVGVDQSGNLHFVLVNARRRVTVKADPLTVELLCRMDGTRTMADLAEIDRRKSVRRKCRGAGGQDGGFPAPR